MQTEDQLKQVKQDLKQKRNPSSAGAGKPCIPHEKVPVPAGTTQHSGPNLPKRSRREVPGNAEQEEQQPFITQREEDQQQEDHRSSPENNIFTEIALEKHDLFKVQDINSLKQFSLEFIAYCKSLCLLSTENTNNLHPVTSTTASAANVSPNNNSLDGFTYNIGRFTLWLTERLKQSNYDVDKKTDLFIDIMKLYSNIEKLIIPSAEAGETLQSLLDEHQEQHSGEEKQYAFAIVFFKDGKAVISSLCYPRHSTKRSHSDSIIRDTLHSEEILIKELDNLFQNNGANVRHVFIYTHNSPCTKREKAHIDPCMSLLRKKADQWLREYGVSTGVAFKAFWGQSRPNYFNYVTDIPSPSSAFYPYIGKCDSIPFKLDWKYFKLKLREIPNLKDVEDKKKLHEDITSVNSLKELSETSFGLKTEHLERGERIIVQSQEIFQGQDIGIYISETLEKKRDEMVHNSFLSLIIKTLNADFNAAQVHLAVEDLQRWDNSPLKLYHILDRNHK